MSFSEKAIKYFCNLASQKTFQNGVEIINPYVSLKTKKVVSEFFSKYFTDNNDRLFVLGINPGRFGGGLTGISFTDPVALRTDCEIENSLGNKKELSSKFIYTVIAAFGGVKKFYSRMFLSALYPFALIKNGKNFNYYDDKILSETLVPEIVKNIRIQTEFGVRKDVVIILGKKNFESFSKLNDENKFYKKIIWLEHPRFIMQYRLKRVDDYVKKYLGAFKL